MGSLFKLGLLSFLFSLNLWGSQFFCTAYCAIAMPTPPAIPGQFFGLCRTDPEYNSLTKEYECAVGDISQMTSNPYPGQIYYVDTVANPQECQNACLENDLKGRPCFGWNTGLPGRNGGLTPQKVQGTFKACEATN
jgi:hypothetical protein